MRGIIRPSSDPVSLPVGAYLCFEKGDLDTVFQYYNKDMIGKCHGQ